MTRYPNGQKRYAQLDDPAGDKISLTGVKGLRESHNGSLTKDGDVDFNRIAIKSATEVV